MTKKSWYVYGLMLLTLTVLLVSQSACKKDPCKDLNCVNGDCVENSNGDASCLCDAGFYGEFCQNVDPCHSINNPCQNGGTCSNNNGVASCDCPVGYTGASCETVIPCDTITCLNDAGCEVDASGIPSCICQPGYFGVNCESYDPCLAVDCPETATCIDGVCYCPDGYEGDNCDVEIREKFYGTYEADDLCESANYTYEVEILVASNGVNEFFISGFGGFSSPAISVVAYVIDETSFEIPASEYPNIPNIESTALCTYDTVSGQISIAYTVEQNDGSIDNCNLILTPQ